MLYFRLIFVFLFLTLFCFIGCPPPENALSNHSAWGSANDYVEVDGKTYVFSYFVSGTHSGQWQRCRLLVCEAEKIGDLLSVPFNTVWESSHNESVFTEKLSVNGKEYDITQNKNWIIFNNAHGDLCEVTANENLDKFNCLNRDHVNNKQKYQDLIALWHELQSEDYDKNILYSHDHSMVPSPENTERDTE